MSTPLLIAIVALTMAEMAAVVLVMLLGPRDQSTALAGVLIGIVGPVVTSLLAIWHAVGAKQAAQAAQEAVRNGQPTQTTPTTHSAPPAGAKEAPDG